MISFPYRNRFKFPFWGDLFSEITNEFCPESVQKRACKKLNKQTKITQTDRIRPIRSSSGVVFWTAKSQIPVADASKMCPENNTPNSLRNPVNGHLRLASVVALSSNGACGAIK